MGAGDERRQREEPMWVGRAYKATEGPPLTPQGDLGSLGRDPGILLQLGQASRKQGKSV